MPGDFSRKPRGRTLLFVKRLLAKSSPVIFEGPLPALLSSQGCFALSCLRGKWPTQSSPPLLPMGTLGLLLPSPPTSLTHVSSLHCLLCQTAWKSTFSLPFLLVLHIFSVGGLTGLVLSSASIQSLFSNPALSRRCFSAPSKKLARFPAQVLCETLQTQTHHALFSFPALCNSPVQLLSPAVLLAALRASLQAPTLQGKLLCYQ